MNGPHDELNELARLDLAIIQVKVHMGVLVDTTRDALDALIRFAEQVNARGDHGMALEMLAEAAEINERVMHLIDG